MQAERKRLYRLQRLERLRAIAKQAAAADAARAEGTLSQLLTLAERTRALATDYTVQEGETNSAALRRLMDFAGGLQNIVTSTSGDAETARRVADDKFVQLASAERRRAVAEERAQHQARTIAKTKNEIALDLGGQLARLLKSSPQRTRQP